MTKIYQAIVVASLILCFGLSARCADSSSDADKTYQAKLAIHQNVALLQEGKLQESRALLEKACLLDPNGSSAGVHVTLGSTLEKLGDMPSARDQYLTALRFDPNFPQALFNLARAYQALGDINNAIDAWKAFINHDPNGPHTDVARQQLQSLQIHSVDQQSNAMNIQSIALKKEGKFQESRAILEQACQLDPNINSWAIHFNLGLTLEKLGDLPSARDQYLVALRFDPNRTVIFYQLARCYSSMGDLDHAIAYYTDYINKEPNGEQSDTVRRELVSLQSTPRMHDDPNAIDYFYDSMAGTNKIERWSSENQPMRVFIESGEGVNGYQPCFNQALIAAFNKWTTTLNNYVSWRLMPDRQSANVVCRWASDRNSFIRSASAEQGETLTRNLADPKNSNIRDIFSADVVFCVVDLSRNIPLTCDQIYTNCLHEVGHVLGIQGHSINNRDVMFFKENDIPVTDLSERDKATMQHIYSIN